MVETVAEGTASSTSVVQLAATDGDSNSITYAFPMSGNGNSAGKFTLTSAGLISTSSSAINLDSGAADPASYDLVVLAKDGQASELTGTVTIHIDITTKNDHTPSFSATTAKDVSIIK